MCARKPSLKWLATDGAPEILVTCTTTIPNPNSAIEVLDNEDQN